MPIFEYKCTECDKKFEELVFGSDTIVTCPDCKSEKIEKLLSSFAASVKSSGSAPCGASPKSCGSAGFG